MFFGSFEIYVFESVCVVSVSRDEENRATKWEIPQSYNVQREREYSEYSFLASLQGSSLSLWKNPVWTGQNRFTRPSSDNELETSFNQFELDREKHADEGKREYHHRGKITTNNRKILKFLNFWNFNK